MGICGRLSRPGCSLLGRLKNAQGIATPDEVDLLLVVAAPQQFQRYVQAFSRMAPALDTAAAPEVRGNADVLDTDELHGVIDLVDKIADRGAATLTQISVERDQLHHATIVPQHQ